MANETPVFVHLTPEELMVLYQQIAPEPSAVPTDELLPDLAEAQRNVALDVARRGLIARLLLDPDQEGIDALNPLALAAAASTLIGERAAVVINQSADGEVESTDFYALDNATFMLHARAAEGIQQFVFLAGQQEYVRAVVGRLDVTAQGDARSGALAMDGDLLNALIVAAQAGEADIETVLAQHEITGETAAALLAALRNGYALHTVMAFRTGAETPSDADTPGQGLTFLTAGDGLWHVEPQPNGAGDNQVQLRPIGDTALRAMVHAHLQPHA